jgi:carboxymethylenebutenolidase
MSAPTTITIPTDAGELPAELWLPQSGRGPGMLVLQEIFGVSRYIQSRAADLAALGYVVLAPRLFWRIGEDEPFEGEGAIEPAFAAAQRLEWDVAVRDSVTAFRALQKRDEVEGGVGVIGFCYGGGLAHQVAGLTGADAVVSYYGSALPGIVDELPPVPAPALHHFGLADQYIPADVVARLKTTLEQQPRTTVLTYEGADHAFDNPDFVLHDAEASHQAWERTTAWLAEHLPVG